MDLKKNQTVRELLDAEAASQRALVEEIRAAIAKRPLAERAQIDAAYRLLQAVVASSPGGSLALALLGAELAAADSSDAAAGGT